MCRQQGKGTRWVNVEGSVGVWVWIYMWSFWDGQIQLNFCYSSNVSSSGRQQGMGTWWVEEVQCGLVESLRVGWGGMVRSGLGDGQPQLCLCYSTVSEYWRLAARALIGCMEGIWVAMEWAGVVWGGQRAVGGPF